MTDPETIMHGLRDRDDEGREALKRIAERCELAEARVRELEIMVTEAHALLQYVDAEIATMPSWQEDRATFCKKFAELVESWDAALAGGKE